MANFFSDNKDLWLHFNGIALQNVVTLLENGFRSSNPEDSSSAPASYEEAIETYRESLELLGDICANFIASRSAGIDAAGTTFANGQVIYAKGTDESRRKLADAGFMGVMLPREYGGAGFPATIYMMMIEVVSRADASLMTLFGYQDVGELIARFGTSAQARQFLPGLASGEHIGAIVLSEPGAGSDLQGIKVSASIDDSGIWRLNGVKHFISNGCGDVLMVLARSERGIPNIFGLSLFVCPKSERVRVTRVEEKMGLHGSPTCELVFDDAPAQLIGSRKAGLTKYILESLAQARFSVASQALGIAQGAYEKARQYSENRKQFGRRICDFPAVAELLDEMELSLQSNRAMLYEGIKWLDLRVQLTEAMHRPSTDKSFDEALVSKNQEQLRKAGRYVNLLSPLIKYVVTESSQAVCINAQQIFGGLGYMRETGIERLVRDIRITTIYEGTSQVQIAASLKYIIADVLSDMFDNCAAQEYAPNLRDIVAQIGENRMLFAKMLRFIRERKSPTFADAVARDFADVYSQIFGAYVLLQHVGNDERRERLCRRYAIDAFALATANLAAMGRGKYAHWMG
jgi:alkylation response protein AidB-like acyl-CoA dehydrogenase